MNTQLCEDVKAVKTILNNGWCQGTSARDSNNRAVSVSSPDAVCFCIAGAIDKVTSIDAASSRWLPLHTAFKMATKGSYSTFNDRPETTKEDVLNLCDTVISSVCAS